MSRTHLLGAASAVALAFVSSHALAQTPTATTIQGGGSTLAEFDYIVEFYGYNFTGPTAQFDNTDTDGGNNNGDTLYWPSGSSTGQAAFLANNVSVDANKVNSAIPVGAVGGANAAHYGASDATFTTSQISGWNGHYPGSLEAGHLIQLPSMGVGVSFPVVNSKVTKNGATTAHKAVAGGIVLTDADLCGIFSGKITDWNQTSAAATTTPGTINVIYRSDGSGTSFLLLNHLAAVCTTSNSNFTFPITPQTTFANVFANGTPPANFTGEKGSSGIANFLDNDTAGAPGTQGQVITATSAIGYLSPDFTTVDPNSDAFLNNNIKSTLVVAAVKNGTLPYIPDVTDVTNALNHAKTGTTLKPPTNAVLGANPTNYVPLIQTTSLGYPVVGFTTFDFAQCYNNANIGNAIISYLSDHYSTTATFGSPPVTFASVINRNGFSAVASTQAKTFVPVITGAILSNTKKWNDNIDNATACKGLVGR